MLSCENMKGNYISEWTVGIKLISNSKQIKRTAYNSLKN